MEKQGHFKPPLNYAHVVMHQRKVQIVLGNGEIYTIARLHDQSEPYLLMDQLMRPGYHYMTVTRSNNADLNRYISKSANFSTLLGDCGFVKELKDAFFPTRKKDKLWFEPFAYLNDEQIQALKDQAKVYEKS